MGAAQRRLLHLGDAAGWAARRRRPRARAGARRRVRRLAARFTWTAAATTPSACRSPRRHQTASEEGVRRLAATLQPRPRRCSGRPSRRGALVFRVAASLPSAAARPGSAVSGVTGFSLNIMPSGRSPIARPSRVTTVMETANGAGVGSTTGAPWSRFGASNLPIGVPVRLLNVATDSTPTTATTPSKVSGGAERAGGQRLLPDLIAGASPVRPKDVVERRHEDEIVGGRDADHVAAKPEPPLERSAVGIEREDFIRRRTDEDAIACNGGAGELAGQRRESQRIAPSASIDAYEAIHQRHVDPGSIHRHRHASRASTERPDPETFPVRHAKRPHFVGRDEYDQQFPRSTAIGAIAPRPRGTRHR